MNALMDPYLTTMPVPDRYAQLRSRGVAIDPLTSPYFGLRDSGEGSFSMGNANGTGMLLGLESLPGADQWFTPAGGIGDSAYDARVNPEAFNQWLQSNGYSLMEAGDGASGELVRWLQDANGDFVIDPQTMGSDRNWGRDFVLGSLALYGLGTGLQAGINGLGAGASSSAAADPLASYMTTGAVEGSTVGGAAVGGGGAGAVGVGSEAAALAGMGGGGLGTLQATGAMAQPVATSAGLETMGTIAAPTISSNLPSVAGTVVNGLGSLAGGSPSTPSAPSSGGPSLTDFLTGNGNASDYGRLLQTLISMYGTNRASDAAQEGQQQANALRREMWEANRADNAPLVAMRNQTLPQIQNLLANPSSITQEPGYQFGLNQGQNQINNSLAAQGGYYSGNQLRASQRFGQDYAGTRLDQSLNRLMGVAGLGQVGSTANQSNNNNLSSGLGNGLMNSGNIRGSGYIGMAGAANTGIGNSINDWQDTWARNQFGGRP